MTDRIISDSITQAITLGISPYPSLVNITTTGLVQGPSGEAAVAGSYGVTLENAGSVHGGNAVMTIATGYAEGPALSRHYWENLLDFTTAGAGVSLRGGNMVNTGYIVGGTGPSAGDLGTGLYLAQGTGINSGTIIGGSEWGEPSGFSLSLNGCAAPGVALDAASFNNRGTIIGGQGAYGLVLPLPNNVGFNGGQGGAGVTLSAGAVFSNYGMIEGGAGGIGGAGGFYNARNPLAPTHLNGGAGGIGGTGVEIASGTLINTGAIVGGTGGGGGGWQRRYQRLRWKRRCRRGCFWRSSS